MVKHPQRALLATITLLLAPSMLSAQTTVVLPQRPGPIKNAPANDVPDAPVNGITYLYTATQKCPTDSDGNEITVCIRANPGDQFRIPKDLRPNSLKPEYRAWALRGAETVAEVGAAGFNDCSASGASGASGCIGQAFDQARRENRERKAAAKANGPR
ncbi:MAG: hypothetical protein BVN33_04890 [Proteobacteria bacterium ST_bin13]|nr:MAG: hypothetical protein BVN33_04890 [Proteobacteria bacterium ST_bin13]